MTWDILLNRTMVVTTTTNLAHYPSSTAAPEDGQDVMLFAVLVGACLACCFLVVFLGKVLFRKQAKKSAQMALSKGDINGAKAVVVGQSYDNEVAKGFEDVAYDNAFDNAALEAGLEDVVVELEDEALEEQAPLSPKHPKSVSTI